MKIAVLKIFLLLFSVVLFGETGFSQDIEKCGGLNQPPCHTLHDRPCTKKETKSKDTSSDCLCDDGLEVKSKFFGTSVCIFPEDGRHGNPDEKVFICGGLNQRPCDVSERSPACYDGLTIRNKSCVKPTDCGGLDQPPCPVSTRTPLFDWRSTKQSFGYQKNYDHASLAIFLISPNWHIFPDNS
jgi:hypothetical protein